MQISRIGEFGLIERFKKSIRLDQTVFRGPGDDCAVLKYDSRSYQLLTCDMLVEGVDFLRAQDPYLVGRKSLAVSLSDIAACAGLPQYCLISLGLPADTRLDYVDRLFSGMKDIAREFKLNIVGGDLSRAKGLTIDVMLLGIVEKKYLTLRDGAAVRDIIFVTGTLGGSRREKHLKFRPRIKEARFLVENFSIRSMIDISDGLVQDLGHILRQSGVGALLYEDLIPISIGARGLEDALYSGEDFELLFTVGANEAKKIIRRGLSVFQPIGEIRPKNFGLRLEDKKGRQRKLKGGGFCHF